MTTPATDKITTTVPVPATPPRPVMDEWGVYDPSQAGLEVIFRKSAPPAAGNDRAK